MRMLLLMIMLGGLLWPCAALAEPAIMSRADRLLEKPFQRRPGARFS